MDARLQRRVQRYGWDKAAAQYERYWADQLRPAQDRLLELAMLQPGEQVLDVACGTGLVALRAAEAVGPTGSVLATDISEAMVQALAATAISSGLAGVTARRMDAGPVALAYSRFDEPTRLDAHREYLESIAPFQEGPGYLIPGEFVVGIGRR